MKIGAINFNNNYKTNKAPNFQTQPMGLKADKVEFSFGSALKILLQKEAKDLQVEADGVLENAKNIKSTADKIIEDSAEISDKSTEILNKAQILYEQVSKGFMQAESEKAEIILDDSNNLEMHFSSAFPYYTTTMRMLCDDKLFLSASKDRNGHISISQTDENGNHIDYTFSSKGKLVSYTLNPWVDNTCDEEYLFNNEKLLLFISNISAKSPYANKSAKEYRFENGFLSSYQEDKTSSQKDIVHSKKYFIWVDGQLHTYKKENIGNQYWSAYEEAMIFDKNAQLKRYTKEYSQTPSREQAQDVFFFKNNSLAMAQVNFDSQEKAIVEKFFVYDKDTKVPLGCYLNCEMKDAVEIKEYDKYIELT